jgi:hypothetical protein
MKIVPNVILFAFLSARSVDAHVRSNRSLKGMMGGGMMGGSRGKENAGSGSCSAALEPPLGGVLPGVDRPKLIVAQDIDYPP